MSALLNEGNVSLGGFKSAYKFSRFVSSTPPSSLQNSSQVALPLDEGFNNTEENLKENRNTELQAIVKGPGVISFQLLLCSPIL